MTIAFDLFPRAVGIYYSVEREVRNGRAGESASAGSIEKVRFARTLVSLEPTRRILVKAAQAAFAGNRGDRQICQDWRTNRPRIIVPHSVFLLLKSLEHVGSSRHDCAASCL
jgi:hypothetical protein